MTHYVLRSTCVSAVLYAWNLKHGFFGGRVCDFLLDRALLAVLPAENTILVIKSNVGADEPASKLTGLASDLFRISMSINFQRSVRCKIVQCAELLHQCCQCFERPTHLLCARVCGDTTIWEWEQATTLMSKHS